jgi:Ion channel
VFDLSALLAKIPDEFKPIAAIAIGAFVLVLIALFHGAGLHRILVQQKRAERRLRVARPHVVAALLLFGGTVFLMLSLHLVEVMIWAFFLTHMGLVADGYDAVYFSANAYTTLGYGSVDLGQHWRNIAPIMGISGLFTFAWTTSSLVAVVAVHRQLIERLEEEREQEMQLRFTLRKNEWAALKGAIASERSEGGKTKTQVSGISFFHLLRLWKEEKKRSAEIRGSTLAEIQELRRKEREDEERLERDSSSKDSEDKK